MVMHSADTFSSKASSVSPKLIASSTQRSPKASSTCTAKGPNTKPLNIFYIWYAELCRRQNSNPICTVRAPNQRNDQILEFNADRIKIEDWTPIINALKLDTSLHVISIHSRMPNQKFIEEADTEDKVKKIKKWFGAICTKFVLRNLIKSIGNSLKISTVLTCLELDGLKIVGDYLQLLLKCLEHNKSLKYLSFKSCPLEDEGCFDICNALHALPNIEVINLSSCSLGTKSAEYLSKLIKYQQINRYCESWHSSLRYEDPVVNKMAGIRRVTINNNPRIGDDGLDFILNELIDDLWIKAVDMQRCGITEQIAGKIIDTVDYSRSLEVFDLRNNHLSTASVERILEILKNKQGDENSTEYQWCFTSTTLDTMTYGSYVSLINTKSTKNFENKRVTIRQHSKTMPHLHKPPLEHKCNKEKLNNLVRPDPKLVKAEEQLVELFKKLKEEEARREEAERKCEELQKQVDELLNQKKNQLILKEFTNMKQYINKFINFVKLHGGELSENEPIIADLQNALDEVVILAQPYETPSQKISSSTISDQTSHRDFEDPIHAQNFYEPGKPMLHDPDTKIKNLFQNLIGTHGDGSSEGLSISVEFDDDESSKKNVSLNSSRSSVSTSNDTLKRLLEELQQEETEEWSTEEFSTVYSEETSDGKDTMKDLSLTDC